jgi:hypothetical protein
VRRLADLSDRELAPLFNMTVPEVRRYRRPAKRLPWDDTSDEARAESERYDQWLWNLPVEEFKKLRESDDPGTIRLPHRNVPFDVAGRFRALQDLLWNQPEFEARYPASFEILFPSPARRRERAGLYLPSFDIRVLNNWTHPHVEDGNWPGGADAYTSVSRLWQKDWRLHEANQTINMPQYDDLQGVLLAILSREEYGERVGLSAPRYRAGDVEGVRGPEQTPIRLTDLRLTEGLAQTDRLKSSLKPVLDLLHRPVSTEHVVLWKLRVLGSDGAWGSGVAWTSAKHLARIPVEEVPEDVRESVGEATAWYRRGDRFEFSQPAPRAMRMRSDLLVRQFGDEKNGVAAVSFAAAALWLFLDLDMPGIEKASSYRLSEQIESLAALIGKAARRLGRSTADLGKLIANRSSGNRPELPGNNHLALQQYRMGLLRDLEETAEWLGITPYSSRTGKGTRNWKTRVKERLREGKEFEDRNYPRAAAIFANRDHPTVRRKARRAYRGYRYEVGRTGTCPFYLLGYWAQVSASETKRGKEIAFAYAQLGSCILQRIPLTP